MLLTIVDKHTNICLTALTCEATSEFP